MLICCNTDKLDDLYNDTAEYRDNSCESIDIPGAEKYYLPNGEYVMKADTLFYMADVFLTTKQVEEFGKPDTRSAVLLNATQRWNNGQVYYDFASGYSKVANTNEAISTIQSTIPSLTFTRKPSNYTGDYILFQNHVSSNNSSLGRIGGRQMINIVSDHKGVIMHEILHALGIFHEQARADRDNYVTINFNNIQSNMEHNYKTYTQRGYTGRDIGVFDFSSLMLYSSHDFAKGSDPVMVKKEREI